MSNNNVICTICAERYRNSDNIHAGSCGHAFHEECLFRWWEQSRTCPICRSEDAAYFQLYLSFENDAAGGSEGGEGGSGRNQSQDNTSRSSSSPSYSASSPSNSASSSSNSHSSSTSNSNSTSHSNSHSNSSSNSASNSNSNSSTSSRSTTNNSRGSIRDLSTGFMREYEILLYEKDLYQQEIEYLNHRIGQLTLRNSNLNCRLAESESDTDSD